MASASTDAFDDVVLEPYVGEHQLQGVIDLISLDLSEPYSIFTYRYFINNWPNLCFLALRKDGDGQPKVVGVIVCKQDKHKSGTQRGYIAMLAVHHSLRKRGMGRKLVKLSMAAMIEGGCDEAVLETEVTNEGALRLYEGLGFARDKRMLRYYLNGNDAFRLKVWFKPTEASEPAPPAAAGGAVAAAEEPAPSAPAPISVS